MKYKRGTAFDYGMVLKTSTGTVVDLTDHTVAAQLRKWDGGEIGDLIADLQVDIDAPNGAARIYFDDYEASAAWPTGSAAFDILITTPGGVPLPTPGFVLLEIIKPATQVTP